MRLVNPVFLFILVLLVPSKLLADPSPAKTITHKDRRFNRRIGDSTVPGRSYHLCHRHQVPQMGGTFWRDRSRESRKGQPEETRA